MVNLPGGFESGILPLRDVPCKKLFYKALSAEDLKRGSCPTFYIAPEIYYKLVEFGDVCFILPTDEYRQPKWFVPALVVPLEQFVHVEK